MKKKVILIIIFIILIGGGSFCLFWLKPELQLKEEKLKEVELLSLHEKRDTFKWKIEAVTKWKIIPKDSVKSSKRKCIWTIEFINRSLDSIYCLGRCEFILKDISGIIIATDYFTFGSYYGYPLKPGKSWEAHGIILLSEAEAQMAYQSSITLAMSESPRLADLKTREQRKEEFLQELEDVKKQIKGIEELTSFGRGEIYSIGLTLRKLGITAENTEWENKTDTLDESFYTTIAKHFGNEIFSDTLYREINFLLIVHGYSDKEIWDNFSKDHHAYKKAKASGMRDKRIQRKLGLQLNR